MDYEILRLIRKKKLVEGIDYVYGYASQDDQVGERITEAFRNRQSEEAGLAEQEQLQYDHGGPTRPLRQICQ